MLLLLLVAARLPPPPPAVAEVSLADDTGAVTVQLRRETCWPRKGLAEGGDPAAHQDPLHTGLAPRLVKQAGATTCLWTGYRPGTHEAPGDTLLTYALLVQQEGDVLTGLWFEDHQEIPRTYFRVLGTLRDARLELSLTSPDGAPPATLTGIVAGAGPA